MVLSLHKINCFQDSVYLAFRCFTLFESITSVVSACRILGKMRVSFPFGKVNILLLCALMRQGDVPNLLSLKRGVSTRAKFIL